jgi:general stress protein CsbA
MGGILPVARVAYFSRQGFLTVVVLGFASNYRGNVKNYWMFKQ